MTKLRHAAFACIRFAFYGTAFCVVAFMYSSMDRIRRIKPNMTTWTWEWVQDYSLSLDELSHQAAAAAASRRRGTTGNDITCVKHVPCQFTHLSAVLVTLVSLSPSSLNGDRLWHLACTDPLPTGQRLRSTVEPSMPPSSAVFFYQTGLNFVWLP